MGGFHVAPPGGGGRRGGAGTAEGGSRIGDGGGYPLRRLHGVPRCAAAKAGALPAEVAEMLGIALLMDGGPASVYAPRAWAAYLEFSDAVIDPALMGSMHAGPAS